MSDRPVNPDPIPLLTPPPVGELVPPVDVYPTPLPLDPLPSVRELAETGLVLPPLVLAAVAFAIVALGLALLTAVLFAKSPVRPRKRRASWVDVSGDVDSAPLSNLLGK